MMKSNAFLLSSLFFQTLSAKQSTQLYVSAAKNQFDQYALFFLNEDAQIIDQIRLPQRGHDIVFHQALHQVIAFPRRPSVIATVIDVFRNEVKHIFSTSENRHFYGHGALSKNGALLFASENDFEHETGIIGIYDTKNSYKRVGEFSSYGIGPHQIKAIPNKDVLIVANGGIITHPDFGRQKLNLSDMEPNIALIDTKTGDLLKLFQLPKHYHQLSIRHFDITNQDEILFGCQYQGPFTETPPLIGKVDLKEKGKKIEFISIPNKILKKLENNIGSIVLDQSQKYFALTTNTGTVALILSSQSGQVVRTINIQNSLGVAPYRKDQFFITNKKKEIFNTMKNTSYELNKIHFGNHLTRIEFSQ